MARGCYYTLVRFTFNYVDFFRKIRLYVRAKRFSEKYIRKFSAKSGARVSTKRRIETISGQFAVKINYYYYGRRNSFGGGKRCFSLVPVFGTRVKTTFLFIFDDAVEFPRRYVVRSFFNTFYGVLVRCSYRRARFTASP